MEIIALRKTGERMDVNVKEINELTTVVIPTLNEVEGIGLVLDDLFKVGISRERVLVVDGGSTDGTTKVAEDRRVRVIRQLGKGKADAIKTVLNHIETPYMLVMDGDYTYPATVIPDLVRTALATEADEVIGIRLMGNGNQGLIYRFGNWLLTKVFNLIFGTKLHDVLSGMYLVRVEALRDALMEMGGFSVEAEIAAHMVSTGKSVVEVPIEYRRRVGEKKLHVKDGLMIFRDIVRLSLRYNPILLLFILGALLLIPGLMLGAYVGYWYVFYGIKYYFKGLIAIMMTLIGLQFLGMTAMAIYMKRMEYRVRKAIESIRR